MTFVVTIGGEAILRAAAWGYRTCTLCVVGIAFVLEVLNIGI